MKKLILRLLPGNDLVVAKLAELIRHRRNAVAAQATVKRLAVELNDARNTRDFHKGEYLNTQMELESAYRLELD